MSLKKDILWRVAVIYFCIVLMAVFIIGRVVYLQVFQSELYKEKSDKLILRNMSVEANRGDIRATDGGMLLATSVPYYEIRVDFLSDGLNDQIINNNIDKLAICLADLFKDRTPLQYKLDLLRARRNGNRYYLLKKWVSYDEMKMLKTFPIFNRGRYKSGLIAIKKNKRIRPFGVLAARTIGYITKGESGNIVGLEGAYDHVLEGTEGLRLMRRITGNAWMPVNDNNQIEPKDGHDLVSTIDVRYQDVAETALYNHLKRHDAHHGCAVLMEVKTGEIKAIANLERNDDGRYYETYNYAIGESTEPGSTFKLPALMAAIEDGYVELDDTIDTEKGKVRYYNHAVEDTKEGGYGRISVKQVFELSSNVGMSKIITHYYKNNPSRFIDRLYRMKLNEKINLRIKGEGDPLVKYPGDNLWSGITLPMMSFGYEIRLTPLQILTFYNAVANNGKMVKPMFIKEVQYHGETKEVFNTNVIDPSICSSSTIKKAKELLKGVVENGTAQNLKNKNYNIAGKTGTVELANEKYGYQNQSNTSYQASFVGYFPADDPHYSCIVVINSPSKNLYYGSHVAGPVFKGIADNVYATSPRLYKSVEDLKNAGQMNAPYTKPGLKSSLFSVLNTLGIKTIHDDITSDWIATNMNGEAVECRSIFIEKELVPSVIGMGAKDATYLLEKLGLNVRIRGRGTVVEQSLDAGEIIRPDDRIVLTMSFVDE